MIKCTKIKGGDANVELLYHFGMTSPHFQQ
jgi:hypothetical protein